MSAKTVQQWYAQTEQQGWQQGILAGEIQGETKCQLQFMSELR